jgi:hypothetical protein
LYLYRDRVRIIAGRFSADHERKFRPGDGSILPEHRAQRVAAVSGKRARRYLQGQHLIDLGAPALAYLTELTHRRPRTWIHEVERLHELLQTHGDAALRTAFERGLAEHAIGAEYIAHLLGTPMSPLPFDDEDRPPTISAPRLPRGGRVQSAGGAPRSGGGAQRSLWTRPSLAARSRRVGGRLTRFMVIGIIKSGHAQLDYSILIGRLSDFPTSSDVKQLEWWEREHRVSPTVTVTLGLQTRR